MPLGPLRLVPALVQRPWGGTALRRLFGKPVPPGTRVGESWEVSDRAGAQSRVADGPHAGKTLQDLREAFGEALVGTVAGAASPGRFPLLIKWIDARENLSVQVHPDDQQARSLGESDPGKAEAWIIADARDGSRMVYGLTESADAETVRAESISGRIERRLRWVTPHAGDCFAVPPGAIHALGANLVVYEVQQNSDLTYRLYDWGRTGPDGRPRDLHLNRAAAVLDGAFHTEGPVPPVTLPRAWGSRRYAVACAHFALETLEVLPGETMDDGCDGRSFHALTVWAGSGEIVREARTPDSRLALSPGETALIPACSGDYRLTSPGGMKIIKAYVPVLDADVVAPLRRAGATEEDIRRIIH